MDLLALAARLTLDKSQYDQGLDDASKGAKSFGDKLKSGLGAAAKVGAAAIATVATAAGAMTTAIVKGAGEVAAYGDNIDKASQKLGISAEAYQEWDAVLQHSGTSIDSLGIGMKTLSAKAAEGSDAFKKLGISQKDAAKMSREELFERTINALQNVQDANKKAQLAQELFGRSAMELGPLLNTSAADTEAMKLRVHELGGVMSDEAVKAAAAYQDSLQDMQTAMEGAKRGLIAEFLPSITRVMDGLTELFSGKDGVRKISEGINGFIDKLADAAPRVLDVGAKIVVKLAEAVINNLPKLIRAATQTILTLVNGIITELPTIVRAGLQIILELARGIAEALPELIPTIVDVMLEIVDVLTEPDTLAQLLEAAIEIMGALAAGLMQAVPKLIEKAPRIIANLLEALIRNAPRLLAAGVMLMASLGQGIIDNAANAVNAIGKIGAMIIEAATQLATGAFEWGKDLILNFWEGIKAFASRPIEAIKDVAGRIRAFLGFSEPEEGPLANFHTYAPDMMALFAQGIRDNRDMITDAIDGAFDLRPAIAANAEPAGQAQEISVPRTGAPSGPVELVLMLNDTELGRVLLPYIEAEARRMGVRLATGGVN